MKLLGHKHKLKVLLQRRLAILSGPFSLALLVALCLFPVWRNQHHQKPGEPAFTRIDKSTAIELAPAVAKVGNGPAFASNQPGQKLMDSYGNLPLSFEVNAGQTNNLVKYLSRGTGYSLFLTSGEAVLALNKDAVRAEVLKSGDDEKQLMERSSTADVVRMRLVGANPAPKIEGLDELPGKSNYLIGSDPAKWRTGISAYRRIRYRSVYPGVDAVYYGNQGQLEYDLIVAPHASHKQIRLKYAGLKSVRIDKPTGDLILITEADGELRQHKPVVYQEFSGERRTIDAQYELNGGSEVAFHVGRYDSNKPLVIDPVLVYSTFLGGNSVENGVSVAVDSQGSAYVTGSTTSSDFPIANAFQSVKAAVDDAFVVKFNPSGTALVYSTYIGGNGTDVGEAIAVDAQGSAYITGLTGSGSFPTTPGAFQTSKDGFIDAFVLKLSPSGSSLIYSTYLGGENGETPFGIAVDQSNRAYVAGRSDSTRLNFFPLNRKGNPLYKSTDAAALWSASASQLTASAVNVITQDPVNANTIYAGTNTGVFKSTNAGANWNLTGTARTATAPMFTNAVVVDPSNTNIIYAATSLGVYKSTDGGSLYDQKNAGLLVGVFALAIDPTTPATLYAGTQFGMFKTTNGGDNWTSINNGTNSIRVNEVVMVPGTPSTIYIGTQGGGMLKTTNAGTSWSPINNGALDLDQPAQISALAIDPLNPLTLYAGATFFAPEILYKTTDGGASWTASSTGMTYTSGGQTSLPSLNTLAVDPVTPSNVYASTVNGAIYKSTNGGANWSQSNTGLPNTSCTAIAVDRTNPANVFAGTSIGNDAFAARFNAAGSALEYLVGFGGAENDEARGVAIDGSGNAYIVGTTASNDFGLVSPFQSTYGGFLDAFVVKINSTGSGFVYATYLGGSNTDTGRAIATVSGSVYVVGTTASPDFPVANAFKPTLDQFDLDGFVTKLNATGSALDFSTYLGGEAPDQAFGLAVDTAGSAYVTGATQSVQFPVLDGPDSTYNASNDAFVTKFNPTGTSLAYSTYLGGLSSDVGNAIAVDALGNAYVVGNTGSSDFPTARPFQPVIRGSDAFVTKIGVEADLSITKRDSRDPVLVNSPFNYALTVNNSGPSPATGVVVTDTLPGSLTVSSMVATQGTCSFAAPTVTCNLGGLAVSTGAVIQISVIPTAIATITNTAAVTGNEPDVNNANNIATETTKISASPSIKGQVKDAGNNGVSGVLMTLTGSQSATALTDITGFYQFAEVPLGGNFVVTPSKTNFSFDPESRTFNSLNTDQTADFLASSCTYSLTPIVQSFSTQGGTGSVNVSSLHGCPWTATSSAGWITITSGASGVGSGVVNFTVSPTSAPRSGHLTIAGLNFAVYQEFNSCATPAFNVDTYSLANSPTVVRSGDLNGDGKTDLVLLTSALTGASIGGSVLLNNGTGAFTTSGFDSGSGGPQRFVLADFNSDGRPDIAITQYNVSFVRILFNNGSGGFVQSANIPFTSQGQSPLTSGLVVADVNQDGKLDLLVATPGTNGFQLLNGNGSGGFTQAGPVSTGNFTVIDTADFNNDGITDLLLAAGAAASPIGVMLGNGSGGFSAPIISTGISFFSVAAIADFDGDGKLDLAVPTNISSVPVLVVMSGDGAGHFSKKSTFFQSQGMSDLTTGDFNSDGKADVAFTRGTQVTLVLGDGLGGLGNQIVVNTGGNDQFPGNFGIVAADLNGDGRPDLGVANYTIGAHVLLNTCATPASLLQLSSPSYSVDEGSDFLAITVSRTGDTSGPATVKYATSDATDVNFVCNPGTGGQITGAASRKCDYHIASGRLRFAAGETSKQIILSIVKDVYVEPTESLILTLSSPTGAGLGSTSTATINITDNDTPGQANPIDGTGFYVRMLYVDLLSREPEPAGLAGWVHRIDFCGQPGEPPPPCDRVTVGGDGFLRSAEFFDREFFVIRLYRTALGRILRYDDVGDLAFVSGFLTDADLELNKQELLTDIMSRSEFGTMYNGLGNAQYVDTMISTAAVTLPPGVRDGWVDALNGATKTRAQVFRELSERPETSARYLHEAQVVSCYYGFFTRNPDAAYFTFLQRYDNGEITLGDLANAFINAAEYRQRFGP